MRERIIHPDGPEEESTEERCFILELSNSELDPELSIARTRVPPGIITAWHVLEGVAERYVVVEGRGRMEVGDLPPEEVGPGDVVLIPAGCRQRIANVDDRDLVFLCMCTPRFTPDVYRDAELGDPS